MHCIVCGSSFLKEITRLERIPASAQYFIHATELRNTSLHGHASLTAYQCKSCTHVQSNSPLVPYYKDVISTSSLSPSIRERRDSRIRDISQLLGNKNPSILEVGAFQGQYLQHLINVGYSKVAGIEHNPISVEIGNASGAKLVQGYILDEIQVEKELLPADILLCFNFLEHIPDPFGFIELLKHNFCSSSSFFYLTMPSFEYIRKANLLQEFIPDHISYFTLRSLETLFKRCNMEIVSIEEIHNSNDLEIVAKTFVYEPVALDSQPFHSLISIINTILIDSFKANQRVAFWGAGHRSLTLISQLQHDYIDFIVDSATFKQGLVCPDTYLPIIGPATFFSFPTDVLFLSLPGVYSDEVCTVIKELQLGIGSIFVITGNNISKISN